MKLTATAGALATATRVAGLAANERSPIAALGFVHLVASSEHGLAMTGHNLDLCIVANAVAEIKEMGEAAACAAQLSRLAAALPPDAVVKLEIDGSALAVSSGRSHYKLPMLATADLQPALRIGEDTGRVELEAAGLRTILSRTAFAASTEMSRPSLRGIHLRADGARLVATAIDGYRIARAGTAAQGTLTDGGLTLPSEVVKPLMRLLKDANACVTLRASRSLIEIAADGFVLTSKLIDGVFPDLRKVIPSSEPRHCATVARAELTAALERLEAAGPPKPAQPATIALDWSEGTLRLSVPDRADEEFDASGVECDGRVTVKLQYLVAPLERLAGERVRLASNGRDAPLLVTDPDDADVLFLMMPCRGPSP